MKKFLLSILCLVAVAMTGYATETTVKFADLGLADKAELKDQTITVDDVTLTFSKGSNTSTTPKFYTNGGAARIYGGNTMTITVPGGYVIDEVVLKAVSSNNFHSATSVSAGTFALDGTVGTITGVNGETVTLTQGGTSGHVRITELTVTYTSSVASNVATPTFTVEAGTYGEKQSVGIECATEGAAIYYTLDGTTPDNTATLYEAPIELNTNTTVKAIAYVGEEASNVASATYEFKLEGSIEFISPAIVAGTMQIKIEWTTEDWASNTVTYHCTLDGTVPSAENKWNSSTTKTRQLPMYSSTWKKDTVVNVSVRAELNGIYSDVFQTTVYCRYAATLDFYRAATAMEAGNYVMFTPATIARRLDDDKTYDYLPTVATTNNNGVASAFGYFEWTFETADGGYYIKDSKGRYIYMAGTYNNFNVSESVPTEGGIWTVSFNSDGTAQIMNVEKNKYIQYSETYNSWGSYPDAQGVMPFLGMNATPKVVMTPELDGQTLTSLSEITFYCADGLAAGTKINNNRVRNDNYDEFKYTVQTVDDKTIKLVFDEPITASGSYTFSYASGSFVAGPGTFDLSAPDANKSIKFTIENPNEVMVSPENSNRLSEIKEFVFSNANGISVNALFEGEAPYLSYKNGEEDAKINLVASTSTETSITLVPETEVTVETTYTLVVADGYFVVGEDEFEALGCNKEYILVFPVTILSTTPAAGEEVSSFTEMIVEFNKKVYLDKDETYNLIDPAGNKTKMKVALIDTTTVEVAGYWNPVVYPISNKARFYVDEPLTAEGEYKAVLSEYGWEVVDPINTVYLDKTTVTFNVKAANEPLAVATSTPAEGEEVESFNEMVVEFNKAVYVADNGKKAMLYNADGTFVANLTTEMLEVVGQHTPIFGAASPLATKVRFYADAAVTTGGAYYVQIPADMFAIDDNSEWNAKTKINFTVKAANEPLAIVSTTPADGQEVENIYEIQVELNKPVYFDVMMGYQPVLRNAAGETVGNFGVDYPNSTGFHEGPMGKQYLSKNLVFFLNAPYTEPGEYDVIIFGDSFKTDDDSETLSRDTIHLTIPGAAEEPLAVATSTPAEGEEVESFSEMVVEFNKAVYVADNSKNAMLYNADGTLVANLKTEMLEVVGQHTPIFGAASPLATKVRFYADAAVATEGAYYVQIPTDMFAIDDNSEWNTKVKINFTIKPAAAPAITATWNMVDGATVENFSSVNITFAGEGITAAKAKNTYGCTWFYEKNADGEWQLVENPCTAGYMDHAYDGTTITLSVDPGCYSDDLTSPFNRKGDYRIVIPAGGIMFNGDKTNLNTEEYVLNFTIYNEYVEPDEVDAAFTVNPANNSKVSALKEMTLTFTDYSEITVAEPDWMTGANLPGIYMYDDLTGATMPTGFYFSFRQGNAANQLVVFVDPNMMYTDAFNLPGTFVVKIPKKVVTFSDGVNKEIELTYTVTGVEKDLYITASDPENNAVVEKLESIIVDWNKGITTPNGDVTNAYIENVHGINVSSLKVSWTDNEGATLLGNRIRYILENPVVESGTYTLIIPAEDLVDFDTESQTNEEERLTFTVEAAAQAPAVVATKPADGTSVDALESIVVNFNIPVNYDGYFDKASIQDKSGKVICEFASATYVDGDAYSSETLIFTLDEKIAEANDYVFVLPAKTITSAIDWMTMMEKDFSMNITVGGAQVDDIILVATTPSANSTVEELTEIVAEFNTDVALMISPDVFDSLDTKVSTTAIEYNDAEGNAYPENIVRLVLNTPITAEGTYFVVFDAGSIYDYPNYTICNSKEYRIKIEVSSFDAINGIEMDPVNGYVVYDINGFRVMQTKKASDLDRLNNGLYIINGVKVLINK